MSYQLLTGDCLAVLPTLAAQSVDAIITDLPYGTTACKWDVVIPFAPMWAEVKRVLRPRGAFVTTASQPFTSALVMSNPGWFKYAWVWDKNYGANFPAVKFMPLLTSEDICVFSLGGANNGSKNPMIYNPIMEQRETPRTAILNRWAKNAKNPKYDCLKGREETESYLPAKYPKSVIRLSNSDHTNRVHPTQKPVALYEYLIRTYTNAGDTVLDIAAGSGTTGVACVQTGRQFIGIEKQPEYVEIARARIEAAQIGLGIE